MQTNNPKLILTSLLILPLLISQPKAYAAGIDCKHANSPSENMICSSDELKQLDLKLAATYAKVAKSSNNKSNLQNKQKQWLVQRDKCPTITCISDSYYNRTTELANELRSLLAYKPDKTDLLALAELKHEVENHLQNDVEFPLESALKIFEVNDSMTNFSNTVDDAGTEDGQHFPKKRPKDVSEDEWKALLKSNIDGGGENGTANYTLLDLDGDGKRDLIIDSYIGGTGLFNYISAVRRKDDIFSGKYVSENNDDFYSSTDDAGALYSLNGRGSNQSATWVKLQGRIYAAYRNSIYGLDNLFLLRPFYINEKTPMLAVHYQYALSIPKKQVRDDQNEKTHEFMLDMKTQATLNKVLKQVENAKANGSGSKQTLCPAPANVSEDERDAYASYGPGHYSYETVVDMAIWLDKTCYIGRLTDWFGGYDKKSGLYAQLWLKKPNSDTEETSYEVYGRRKAVKIDAGIDKFYLGE